MLKFWGPAILAEVEKRLAIYVMIGLALLVGGFFALKLLHA